MISEKFHSFTFLFKALEKATEISSNIKGHKGASLDPEVRNSRLASLDSIKSILLSYSGLSLQDNSLFGGNSASIFVDMFLTNPSNYTLYFNSLINRFHEDGLTDILSNIIREINSRILGNSNIIDGASWVYLKAFEFIFSLPQVPEIISQIDWFMYGSGRSIQTSSVLGPIFSISAFPGEDDGSVLKYFDGLDSSSRSNQEASVSSLQSSVTTLQAYQFRIVNTFVRASKKSREKFVSWAAKAVFSNLKRTGFQADPNLFVSNGFSDNLANVLIELCRPFSSDPVLSKLKKINITTWGPCRASSGLLDEHQNSADVNDQTHFIVKNAWDDLTRLCSSSDESLAWDKKIISQTDPKTDFGFIPDIFFITTLAINFGPLSNFSKLKQLGKQVHEVSQSLESIESSQQSNDGNRPPNPLISRWKEHLKGLKCKRLAMESHCLDPRRLSGLLIFSRFSAASLLDLHQIAIASDLKYWECFPEYLLEDILSLLLFATRYSPEILENPELSPPQPGLRLLEDLFVSLFVASLSKPELIRNPHLKSKLVEVLHSLTYFPPEDDDDYVDTLISSDPSINPFDRNRKRFIVHPIVNRFIDSLTTSSSTLMPSSVLLKSTRTNYPPNRVIPVLLQLYVDIEHTGSSSSFYDKFSVRYNIARIMRSLWNKSESQHLKSTKEFFLNENNATVEMFVSRIVGDTTYLLDESLSKLSTIRQLELPNDSNESVLERRQELQSAERQASSYITLAHETVHMLSFLTQLVPNPFRSDSIILRLAAMLNYNLDLLAGPKCSELKVQKMESRFHFRPKILLSELLGVYINLGSYPVKSSLSDQSEVLMANGNEQELFINALAQDERSWNVRIFKQAIGICTRYGLKSQKSIDTLFRIAKLVQEEVKRTTQVSAEFGDDIPDEFLDPIMYTLMENPVLLPTSSMVVDFKTIKGYLLTDPRDPFNREHLDIADVVPVTELKERIEQFKREASSKKE
ncbi:E4 ubiquitin-protein ligase UFD2 [Smittium mucronatum]|uniref:RING-type E3 ubiquitin transferase n=1 Tax=Smittium mucronatum TaxID=133383 RepID=A0A1R0H0J9_9FUNG|nr:E4 ubiquitin-protein ligase UFD2 [Smittium mucronatum]